ncbi:MAG: hypothetical protein Pg6C_13100 [Treponemataceae bacterium]|nr:MAG: hypothetical protein Pg6C_13100 [Treponemataceae bacterium]
MRSGVLAENGEFYPPYLRERLFSDKFLIAAILKDYMRGKLIDEHENSQNAGIDGKSRQRMFLNYSQHDCHR